MLNPSIPGTFGTFFLFFNKKKKIEERREWYFGWYQGFSGWYQYQC